MKKRPILLPVLLSVLLLCMLLWGCQQPTESLLTLDFFKIGKADAILIEGTNTDGTPFYVLVDTGESDDASEIVGKIRAAGTDRLDYLILTHFDKDHIGGLPSVLQALSADHILMPDYVGEGEPYEVMTALFSDGTYPVRALTEDIRFTLGQTQFSVSVPKQNSYAKKQDNNASLAVTVCHGTQVLLLAGDAESERQAELMTELDAGGIKQTALLKVPHHGVYNDGIDAFFAACAPKYAVITCSAKKPPEAQTLSLLHALDTKVFLTSDGDIRAVCTENSITVIQQ